MKESTFFAIVIVVLVIVFLNTGSHLHSSQPAASTAELTIAGTSTKSSTEKSAEATSSPYKGMIRLSYGYPTSRDVGQEYVTLVASYGNEHPVSVSGWRLYSPVTGKSIAIGLGSTLPELGSLANEQIMLKPNEYAYVIAGRSPEGSSFRDNKCTGYFTQSVRFYPNVSGYCPRPPADDSLYRSVANPNQLPVECRDYVASVPSCSIVPSVPQRYAACAEYVDQHFSYDGCVTDFKNDKDFYLNHWFIYENQSEPIWRPDHDTIVLYDLANKEVDTYSY